MNSNIIITEQVNIIGEGEYNLNALKEIKVTDSFIRLNQDVRNCQFEEPFYNCTTRKHIETMKNKCGCLPFSSRLDNKVLLTNIALIL